MVRLLIADAQCIVRMGMRQLCRDLGGFTVAGEAASGEETLAALESADFDMAVIEPNMPHRGKSHGGDGGVILLDTIRARHAALPILVFTGNDDPYAAQIVLNKGVRGLLTKESDRETLATAMRRVSAGESFISSDIAIRMMFENSEERETALLERLSARELQIMKLLCRGMSVNAIAEALFINNRTVSTHKARLMQKMNFRSNAEMFHYAVECGLVESKSAGARNVRAGALSGKHGMALSIVGVDETGLQGGEAPVCSECTTCEHYRRPDSYK